jgi:hypothetical protein
MAAKSSLFVVLALGMASIAKVWLHKGFGFLFRTERISEYHRLKIMGPLSILAMRRPTSKIRVLCLFLRYQDENPELQKTITMG